MLKLNKGEWSEIYCVLYLLANPKLKIANDQLLMIDENDRYEIKKIIFESNLKLEYKIVKKKVDSYVEIYIDGKHHNKLSVKEIDKGGAKLLNIINSRRLKKGAFTIPSLNDLVIRLTNGHMMKSKSMHKHDIILMFFDNHLMQEKTLSYSIKSLIGSPATLLNASPHTNFLYEIKSFDIKNIDIVNSISSRNKLLKRIQRIRELGGKIEFKKVCSETFSNNLSMIELGLGNSLGNSLLYSYTHNVKALRTVFLLSNNFDDEEIGLQNLAGFLLGASFGFIPSQNWDQKYTVTGCLLVVKRSGEVLMLDLVHYHNYVINYLINETKMDSPSSKRFNMLKLYKTHNKTYFTLNLQVRYKH